MQIKSKFFAVEGLDGAGKSTQIALLTDYFNARGIETRFVHFPRSQEGVFGELTFNEGLPDYSALRSPASKEKEAVIKEKKKKAEAGSSRRGSLELFLGGKTLQEIATERSLAVSTVESHLAGAVAFGELELEQFIDEKKISLILPLVKEMGVASSSPIKAKLGDTVTWAEIRAVQNYYRKMNPIDTE